METRRLGGSDLEVSVIGLGGNNFGGRLDLAATRRVVHKAIDAGITLIDTADAYNNGASEECLGEVLGERRKHVVLATKFGLSLDASRGRTASRSSIVQAVEASLQRLRTDWIDLYQLHRPDPATPMEETLRALDDLVRHGKVRHIGCSNLSARELTEAQETAARHDLTAFISCQDQYSLLARDIERALLPTMQVHKLGLLPYFPLASGLLTGKYRRDACRAARASPRASVMPSASSASATGASSASSMRSAERAAAPWSCSRSRGFWRSRSSPASLLAPARQSRWTRTPVRPDGGCRRMNWRRSIGLR